MVYKCPIKQHFSICSAGTCNLCKYLRMKTIYDVEEEFDESNDWVKHLHGTDYFIELLEYVCDNYNLVRKGGEKDELGKERSDETEQTQ